ncbi:MAG: hypothetical protein RL217_1940 [Pseudomonadota bacterium]|jgi:diguanylate cyclase (GGDEF)-like protein/PAS domain S-box-containing protein
MKPTVRAISLKLWLPITILLFGLLLFALLLVMQLRSYERDLNTFINQTAHDELLRTQRALEMTLRRDDNIGVDSIISDLSLNPNVAYALLWDAHGWVMSSTQFAWKGQRIESVLSDYGQPPIDQWQQLWQESLTLDPDGKHLLALSPVNPGIKEGELRANRYAVLLIVYDLTPRSAYSWGIIEQQSWVFALAILFAVAALYLFARIHILRPAILLQKTMQRIGSGDFSVRENILGQGEFKDLDNELAQMAHQLNEHRQGVEESTARLKQLTEASLEAIVFHENGVVIDANSMAEQLYAVKPGGLIGSSILDLIAEHHRALIRQRMLQGVQGVIEVDIQDSHGQVIPVESNVSERLIHGRPIRVVVARDIRPHLEAEATIRQLSQYDALTGLPNRRMLIEQVQAEVEAGEHSPRRAALATFNLNMFKNINDSMGMAAGDAVLRAIAKRLAFHLQAKQFIVRVVGDTFALLLVELDGNLEQASTAAANQLEKILDLIQEPLEVQGQLLHISAGAGVVMIPNDSKDAPELLREAETAMHQAKQKGLERIHFFAHALQEAASARLALRNELQHMLKHNPEQLRLHYQPQVNRAGELVGVEALVRWLHPKRGLIPPLSFIGEAESSGLIVPLGNLVLQEAALCLKRWQMHPYCQRWAKNLTMAVNVSPRQFREKDFVQHIQAVLQDAGIQAQAIELELTESVVADDLDATLKKMNELKALGLRFALDDFGTLLQPLLSQTPTYGHIKNRPLLCDGHRLPRPRTKRQTPRCIN